MKFWCGTAFMDGSQMPAVARMLDEAGFDGVFTSDHVIFPRQLNSPYMSPDGKPFWAPSTAWPDSWVLIGAMAATTERLRFSSVVYIAAARPLLEVAKQVATAADISGGRVSLAVGAGWMREEFELLGQPFENRGRRLTEMIQALPALWKGGWVSWEGEYYSIPEIMLEPHPPGPVPILCGGESEAALRRAAQYCDGWVGTAYDLDTAKTWVEKVNRYRVEYGRSGEDFEIIVALFEPASTDLFRQAEDIGITGLMISPWAAMTDINAGVHADLKHPAEYYREPIERFAEEFIGR